MMTSGSFGRRGFLLTSAAALGSWAVPQSFGRLMAALSAVRSVSDSSPLRTNPRDCRCCDFQTGFGMSHSAGRVPFSPDGRWLFRQHSGSRYNLRHYR